MSKEANNPTTQNQKIIIALISVVMVILLAQLLINIDRGERVDRESCLQRGDIWSESTGECYESSSMGVLVDKQVLFS